MASKHPLLMTRMRTDSVSDAGAPDPMTVHQVQTSVTRVRDYRGSCEGTFMLGLLALWGLSVSWSGGAWSP